MEDRKVNATLLGHEIILQDVVANVAGAVEWTEDYVKDAVKDLPYASIAVAGVSLVLPFLKNPSAAEAANQDRFTYVTSQMRYYNAMESLLLPEDMKSDLRADLKACLVAFINSLSVFRCTPCYGSIAVEPRTSLEGLSSMTAGIENFRILRMATKSLF